MVLSCFLNVSVTVMCRDDELSCTMSWVGCLLTDLVLSDKYMKVKIMEIKEILRRIGLFSENKTKSSEPFCKQPTQLIIVAHNCHTSKRISSVFFFFPLSSSVFTSQLLILLFCLHLSVHGKIKKITIYKIVKSVLG